MAGFIILYFSFRDVLQYKKWIYLKIKMHFINFIFFTIYIITIYNICKLQLSLHNQYHHHHHVDPGWSRVRNTNRNSLPLGTWAPILRCTGSWSQFGSWCPLSSRLWNRMRTICLSYSWSGSTGDGRGVGINTIT